MRRLERSRTDRVIAGVCGGLGRYLEVDSTLVRFLFVVATVFTAGLFLVVYLALLVLMPLPGERAPIDDMVGRRDAGATEAAPAEAPQTARPAVGDQGRDTIAYVLIALGLIFLVGNLGAFRLVEWGLIWPLLLVALGVWLLVRRTRP